MKNATAVRKTVKELEADLNATNFFCDVTGQDGGSVNVTINDIYEEDITGLVKYLKTADAKIWGT